MFIVDLKCINDHSFEGWYKDYDEYRGILDAGELTCPLCETSDVERVLTTGEPKTSKTRDRQERQGEIPLHEYQWERNFADQAIAMHKGKIEERPIAGPVSDDDVEKLEDAGVPTTPIDPVELAMAKMAHVMGPEDDDTEIH